MPPIMSFTFGPPIFCSRRSFSCWPSIRVIGASFWSSTVSQGCSERSLVHDLG